MAVDPERVVDDGTPAGAEHLPMWEIAVTREVFNKAKADAKGSGMSVPEWIAYVIRDYAPPQDGTVPRG